jgi:hypothetical protein
MAIPAPAIPSGNAYTVNVAHPSAKSEDNGSPLATFAAAAALLLRPWKIPVRLHASGDSARLTALREFLAGAGAKPSGFSPSPSAEIPGEGFWKTTVVVVEAIPASARDASPADSSNPFWAQTRADKKVEWDPLLVALCDAHAPADFPASMVGLPDLWCVHAPSKVAPEDLAARWMQAGAGAVCVMTLSGFAWQSNNAVFGQSSGCQEGAAVASGASALGIFSAGIMSGVLRDLLEENLFEKTLVRADRECLEVRPVRLGRACLQGIAALQAAHDGAPAAIFKNDLFKKNGGLAERTQQHLAQLRGPESKPWGSKGR